MMMTIHTFGYRDRGGGNMPALLHEGDRKYEFALANLVTSYSGFVLVILVLLLLPLVHQKTNNNNNN